MIRALGISARWGVALALTVFAEAACSQPAPPPTDVMVDASGDALHDVALDASVDSPADGRTDAASDGAPDAARPLSIALSPTTGTLHAGSTEELALHATAAFADGTTRDVTQLATWTSSASTMSPQDSTLAPGETLALSATGAFSDGTDGPLNSPRCSLAWTSSDPSIAEVSPSGVITALRSGGPVTITAGLGWIIATTRITVSATP